ncbi:MAG: hypothetical protein ACKO96_41145 [Flammeovirgaceae bacterium]
MKHLLSILVLLTTLQFKATGQFKDGHYYKKDGTKISGLIKFKYGGNVFTNKSDGDCSISFKTDKRGKKINLTTNDICCFVIEKDSFAIIKNFRLNAFVTYPQDFAQVLEIGKINLYLYYSTVQSGSGQYGGIVSTVTDWVIEKDGKADKLTKKKFKELVPLYLVDYPELLDKINNDQLKYDDSEKIIKMYNDFWRGK